MIQVVLEKCAIFLAEVQDQSKNDEHFVKAILGSLRQFSVETVITREGAGVLLIPISNSFEIKHDAHLKLA